MQVIRNSSTGVEPVTLAEAKNWLRLDSDLTADDALITMLISDARIYAENYTARFYKPSNISILVYKTNKVANRKGYSFDVENQSIPLVGRATNGTVVIKRYYEDVETILDAATIYKVNAIGDKVYLRSSQEWGDFDYFLITYDVVNESDEQIKKCILNQIAAEYDWRKDGKMVNKTKINAALDQTRDFAFK